MEVYLNESLPKEERIINLISKFGGIDGSHHKQWCLDQIVRIAMGCPVVEKSTPDYDYKALGENERYTKWAAPTEEYAAWDKGIAP